MPTISQDEFKKRYGDQGLQSFAQPAQPAAQGNEFNPFTRGKTQPSSTDIPSGNYFKSVGENFKAGVNLAAEGVNEAQPLGGGGVKGLATGVEKIFRGTGRALFSPVAPPVGELIGRAGEGLSNTKFMQDYGRDTANLPAGETPAPERILEGVATGAEDLGYLLGGGLGKKGGVKPEAVPAEVSRVTPPKGPDGGVPPGSIKDRFNKVGQYVKDTARDALPNKQSEINENVAKALDLTPDDLYKISEKTGNDVGGWLSEKNLIGKGKEETIANVQGVFDQNYKAVRDAIDQVKKVYQPNQVPRYTDALTAIKQLVDEVPGMEKDAAKVDNLLHKTDLTLKDVQAVKELVDEKFSLFKETGDVKQGIAKQGLANIRGDIKSFIEGEVKEATGQDVGALNNDVMTSKGILDIASKRSNKALTRSRWTKGDTPLAMFAVFNPLVGIPAFIIKKAFETPTARLLIARALDKMSDAQKARVEADINANKIPQEIQQILQERGIEGSPSESSSKPTSFMDKAKKFAGDTMADIKKNGNRGFVANPFAGKEFADSVLQIAHKDGTSSFMRIPKDQFEKFKTMVDDGQQGMAGMANKEGDIYHLTAKSPEQMMERGFEDKGVADVSNLPKKVTAHTRGKGGVREYLR